MANSRNMVGFRVPVTFPTIATLGLGESDPNTTRSILEESLAKSRPTSIDYCTEESLHDIQDVGARIILGCEDGAIYVLYRALRTSFSTSSNPLHAETSHQNLKSLNSDTGSISSLPTPLVLSPTFHVTAKPRIVSGVTTDPVEAPKNYVDFEDEPDKLKDILKGKNPKERRSISEPQSEKSPKTAATTVPPNGPPKRKIQPPGFLLSAANSRAPTPLSLSAPDSPQESNVTSSPEWSLLYHIVTSPMNIGNPIKWIQPLDGNRFFAILSENGFLALYTAADGQCVASMPLDYESSSHAKDPKSRDVWTWCSLSLVDLPNSIILIATAENSNRDPLSTQEGEQEQSSPFVRCIVVELTITPSNAQLQILNQFDLDGPANGAWFSEEFNDNIACFYINHDGHLICKEVGLRPMPSVAIKPIRTLSSNNNNSHLPIPNSFKSLISRSSERLISEDAETTSQTDTSTGPRMSDIDNIGPIMLDTPILGLRILPTSEQRIFLGAAWGYQSLAIFRYTGHSLSVLFCTPISNLKDAVWLDYSVYALIFEDRLEVYQLRPVSADNEEIEADHMNASCAQPELVSSFVFGCHDTVKINKNTIIYTNFSEDNQLILSRNLGESSGDGPCIMWRSKINMKSAIFATSILPLDSDCVVQGYSDGFLRHLSLAQLTRKSEISSVSMKKSSQPLDGYVVGLHTVQNQRTRERYIVGGADDGSIAFWSLSTLELVARWTIFATPLKRVLQFEADKTGALRGCALCVSLDGSIAIIVVDGLHFLYLIPGSTAPLSRICLGGNNLLLIYSDSRARLWDAQTKELWRSMNESKADELLAQGGWRELTLHKDACIPKLHWSSIAESSPKGGVVSSLNLNLESFLTEAITITKSISTSKDEVREILLTLDRLRFVLSAFLLPGLSHDVDSICYGKLGAFMASTSLGLTSHSTTTFYNITSPRDVWCVSPVVTASRALGIIAVLRTMSLFEELTEGASIAVSFFTTSLGSSVGHGYKPPSLEYLGKRWFEASNEFRQSIRTLFESSISNLSDDESIRIAEKWQHDVPSLQPDAEKETLNAALALFICGSVAAEKYSLLSVNALMDISKSINLYLNDEKSIYRVLAIDLCSRGFNVWQHYVDALEILRSLFNLATSIRKDSISIQNVGSQARLAVLNIASDNMPLFMGTICLDILTPPSMEHRRSVLQILAFLIRKRPHVLQPNLPRLMEAVVKSLDPNSTADRDLVLDTATEIIGYVVKTFPMVDFHMSTQRLAVGTNEGAVVMYDLKTAIRLYVLEGHKKPITALSFSPDGRRLVTISLKESVVLAWKVGSSFASFFNPGAPPRQGHGGSQPFKTLNFNIGSEGNMTTAESIDLVRVEWVADRSVKVKIRQSVLTFST